jgi:hypothetical protein
LIRALRDPEIDLHAVGHADDEVDLAIHGDPAFGFAAFFERVVTALGRDHDQINVVNHRSLSADGPGDLDLVAKGSKFSDDFFSKLFRRA